MNTTKNGSEGPIAVVTISSGTNEMKGGSKKQEQQYKSGLARKEEIKWKRKATIELMGAMQKNRNTKLQGAGVGQPY